MQGSKVLLLAAFVALWAGWTAAESTPGRFRHSVRPPVARWRWHVQHPVSLHSQKAKAKEKEPVERVAWQTCAGRQVLQAPAGNANAAAAIDNAQQAISAATQVPERKLAACLLCQKLLEVAGMQQTGQVVRICGWCAGALCRRAGGPAASD